MDSLAPVSLQRGKPWPMGASFDGQGVNFAVFSAHAQSVQLCLFDETGARELRRLPLPGHSSDVWHGYLPGAGPGLIYGFRASGLWRPDKGHWFDSSKLLLDPYARDIVGDFIWRDDSSYAEAPSKRAPEAHDNARIALKARVVHDTFSWGQDKPPDTALADTVLYECHVKGLTARHPDVPPALRGTYAGLAHPVMLRHLQQLGVTAVSLLPVHYALSEKHLITKGLTNYWGYNTIGFFCVNPRMASGQQGSNARDEFRHMVRSLHQAGIEVILDVVYNHTAEGGQGGPIISFRGLDNASYYMLVPGNPSQYENHSGCGNTLNIQNSKVLQLVMDSLRYWVQDMHVDGFRFDLASVLGRDDEGFSQKAAFFAAVAQDPLLGRVKLIAEPWDIGPGGYQVGGFPRGWMEWNDHFRDGTRRFWVQSAALPDTPVPYGTRGDFAMRLCGSSDLFQLSRRPPAKSVNYIVSHDGFTLLDLVSYNTRHNQANGEDNRDGHGNNLSYNCGVEGPTDVPRVRAQRARLQRALLATLLLSQGTPMLCGGDEIGHTQGGNNNPYCQDNAITWVNWQTADADLLAFTQRVLRLRQQLAPFANCWYSGVADADGVYDLSWWNADGSVLQGDAWHQPMQRSLMCLIGRPGRSKLPILLLINASVTEEHFVLPRGLWQALLDTQWPTGEVHWLVAGSSPVRVAGHSVVVMQAVTAVVPT
jgi:glycogen operon protein